MAPHNGLVHLKEYDIKDSNVELIGSDLDHKVKHASAETEPAWNDGRVGIVPGLFVWRIEDFAVVPIPPASHGIFYDGDSYIILHSQEIHSRSSTQDPNNHPKLTHDIYFFLGARTSQDEAGTAAYKTVELDSFLRGAATQHRELQARPSAAFLALFPHLTLRRGGVASGFRHVDSTRTTTHFPLEGKEEEVVTLLRVFRHQPSSSSGNAGGAAVVVVHEVEPSWRSLDEGDVFVAETAAGKVWVWQGGASSPMERARAAQEGDPVDGAGRLRAERPITGAVAARPSTQGREERRRRRLFRLSDEYGELRFGLVKHGADGISRADLDGSDVFVLDDGGETIWVWEGQRASSAEKAMWLKVAQAYVRHLQREGDADEAHLTPIAKVREGYESPAFLQAMEAA
ncbi:0a0a4f5c-12f0-477f-bc8b-f41e62fe69f5 [Thermothielavioides terrestris]|uniref:0a0a4f5c-12f0-477f-bc8b-f41e62fe69f5 n=1 Tax=Thermothielavioides terrestris TaxID=2587410 RepID=A0A446BPJ6_9PEZI|nr:0a0a4f5c-12f0-477f-bc8b-f41e62fe69f5 [Thermothielavioides terrestris]